MLYSQAPESCSAVAGASCEPSHKCSCYLHGCPCGFHGDSTRENAAARRIIQRYLSKISGPLLDRIDLHIQVPGGALQGDARQRRWRVLRQ